MPTHVTIADVAREAGILPMTVSRVINNKNGVGQETRNSIEEVIKKLGYRPGSVAPGLAVQRTCTINYPSGGNRWTNLGKSRACHVFPKRVDF